VAPAASPPGAPPWYTSVATGAGSGRARRASSSCPCPRSSRCCWPLRTPPRAAPPGSSPRTARCPPRSRPPPRCSPAGSPPGGCRPAACRRSRTPHTPRAWRGRTPAPAPWLGPRPRGQPGGRSGESEGGRRRGGGQETISKGRERNGKRKEERRRKGMSNFRETTPSCYSKARDSCRLKVELPGRTGNRDGVLGGTGKRVGRDNRIQTEASTATSRGQVDPPHDVTPVPKQDICSQLLISGPYCRF
jgi:hypothetical protein